MPPPPPFSPPPAPPPPAAPDGESGMGAGREARTKPYAVLAQLSCVCCFLAVPKVRPLSRRSCWQMEQGIPREVRKASKGSEALWWQVVKAQSSTEGARPRELSHADWPFSPGCASAAWLERPNLSHSTVSCLQSHVGPVLLGLPSSRAAQVTGAGLGKKNGTTKV